MPLFISCALMMFHPYFNSSQIVTIYSYLMKE